MIVSSDDTVATSCMLNQHGPFSQGYLCPLSANTYGIEFLKFEIKDYDTNKIVYQVGQPH